MSDTKPALNLDSKLYQAIENNDAEDDYMANQTMIKPNKNPENNQTSQPFLNNYKFRHQQHNNNHQQSIQQIGVLEGKLCQRNNTQLRKKSSKIFFNDSDKGTQNQKFETYSSPLQTSITQKKVLDLYKELTTIKPIPLTESEEFMKLQLIRHRLNGENQSFQTSVKEITQELQQLELKQFNKVNKESEILPQLHIEYYQNRQEYSATNYQIEALGKNQIINGSRGNRSHPIQGNRKVRKTLDVIEDSLAEFQQSLESESKSESKKIKSLQNKLLSEQISVRDMQQASRYTQQEESNPLSDRSLQNIIQRLSKKVNDLSTLNPNSLYMNIKNQFRTLKLQIQSEKRIAQQQSKSFYSLVSSVNESLQSSLRKEKQALDQSFTNHYETLEKIFAVVAEDLM